MKQLISALLGSSFRAKNYLGASVHVVAGWVPLFWVAALQGFEPPSHFFGLMLWCGVFSLLPDIDISTSFIGRGVGRVSKWIETRCGHRTITHSWLALLLVFLLTFLFPHGWLLFAAYASHLLIDMLVGQRGIRLFWPSSTEFGMARLESGGTGEKMLLFLLLGLLLAPFLWPDETSAISHAVKKPTPTATIAPVVDMIYVDIPHVRDQNSEILVNEKDKVTKDQLLADLAGYRADQIAALATEAPILVPTATWEPNPVAVARAEMALEAAKMTATAHAQPLPPDAGCLSVPSEQLLAAEATATAADLQAKVTPVVDEGLLMQVEAELAQAKAAYAGQVGQLYADLQAAQLQATVQVAQMIVPTQTPAAEIDIIKAKIAFQAVQATGTVYAREGVDRYCFNQASEALIMARQTATVAVIEADPERNGDEQVLRQARAEWVMAMADYDGKLTQLEIDWQAAQLAATASILALEPTVTPTSTPDVTQTSEVSETSEVLHTQTPITPIVPILSITTTGTIAPDVTQTSEVSETSEVLTGTIAPDVLSIGKEEQQEEQIAAETVPFVRLYLPLLLKGPLETVQTAQNEGNAAPVADEVVDIERKKVQLMLDEARGKYESQRQQAESELELSSVRATQTIQALGKPVSLAGAAQQLWRAELEQEQRCLLPTPDPVQSMILQKEIDLARMAWLELVFPPTIPVSLGQDMVSRAQIKLELEHAASHYESGRAEAKAKFDQAAAQATATVQALQPTPLVVTPISLSEAQFLLEEAKKAHQQQCIPATPDADTLFFAQREVELAHLRLLAVLTPTAAPLPAPTIGQPNPSSRITTTINAEDSTRFYSPVAGQVQEIKIIKAGSLYATIRITIELADGQQTSCRHLPPFGRLREQNGPSGLPASNYFICRDIYALSANVESKLADFVAYCITPEQLNGPSEQSREWMADPDLPEDATLEPEDYRGANQALGTDRGHLAPLASFRGANWQQTNYLSNIVPQKSALNRGAWKDLEDRERKLARQHGQLCAITGPIYERDMPNLPNADEPHRVPSGFYKIISYGGEMEAYVFDQDTPEGTDYRSGLSTIEEIERLTGLGFR